MKNRKIHKTVCLLLLLCYAFVMLKLMLFDRTVGSEAKYNFVPFYTVYEFIVLIINKDPTYMRLAIVNLIGNVVMFIPIGLLLPEIWKRQQSCGIFAATVALVISTLEVLQLLTRRGACDIDDLILNLAGALTGFAVNAFLRKKFTVKASLPQ